MRARREGRLLVDLRGLWRYGGGREVGDGFWKLNCVKSKRGLRSRPLWWVCRDLEVWW